MKAIICILSFFLQMYTSVIFSQPNIDTLDHLLLAFDNKLELSLPDGAIINYDLALAANRRTYWLDLSKNEQNWGKIYAFRTRADTVAISTTTEKAFLLTATNGIDSLYVGLNFYDETPQFSSTYRRRKNDKATVELPIAYELVNIALELSQLPSQPIQEYSLYRRQVQQQLKSLRSHPLIIFLRQELEVDKTSKSRYLAYRDYAIALEYQDGTLFNSTIYPKPFRVNPWYGKALSLLQQFGKSSAVQQFIASEKGYYEKLKREQEQFTELEAANTWLKKYFKDSVNHVKVVFSPLTKELISSKKFQDEGFTELVLYMDSPEQVIQNQNSNELRRAIRTGKALLELSRAYLQPLTQKYREDIRQSLSKLKEWKRGVQPLGLATEIFEEYLALALLQQYVRDTYQADQREAILFELMGKTNPELYLPKFSVFSKELARLLKLSEDESPIPAIYPLLIDWAARQ